jgi:hypothetical protein
MKKLFMILPIALFLCLIVGCQQSGEEVTEDEIPDELVPSNLKDATSAWFEGLLAEDTTILNKVLSDDVTLGFPGGNVMPRAKFLSFLRSGELFYDTAEHEDVGFRIYGNTAVVTGRSNLAYRFKGNEGFERLSYTAVYVSTDGEWKMVAWQSTTRLE